jgi:hypothetical protein
MDLLYSRFLQTCRLRDVLVHFLCELLLVFVQGRSSMTVPYTQYKADSKAITFDSIDKDGNGNLDVQELKDVIIKLRNYETQGNKDEGLIQIFTKADLDANGDGVITFDEFWATVIKGNDFEDEDTFAESFGSQLLSVEDWERVKETLKAALV